MCIPLLKILLSGLHSRLYHSPVFVFYLPTLLLFPECWMELQILGRVFACDAVLQQASFAEG
jgi:hypothetical protein